MSYLDAHGRWGEVEERSAFGLLDDGAEAAVISGRAKNLERNNALAKSVLYRAVENYVGPRIALRPATSSAQFNKAVEKRQKFYFSGHWIDVRRMRSFDGLIRLAVHSMLRDGDCGFVLLKINGRPQLQFIEGALIEQPMSGASNVRDGIEWGSNGQPLAFYIRSYDEYGVITHTRVAARDFIYLCDHPRGGSTRGLSRFTGSFSMFNNLAGFVDAAVKTARTQNAQAILAKSARPNETIQGRAGKATVTDGDGNTFRTIPIEGGAVNVISNVDEMVAFQPSAPGSNLDQGVTVFGRFVGLSFGMPYDDVFLDYTKANFSNSRMRRLAMNVAIEIFQLDLKAALFDRFWPWFVSCLVKAGEIDVEAPSDSWEYEWTPSARPSNDPLKEAQAAKAFIEMGVEAPQNVAEAMGYDWPTLLATIKRNRDELLAAGIDPANAGVKQILGADGKPIDPNASAKLDPRTQVDAYGIGVRAGAVTPQIDDETALREALSLPVMSDEAKAAWKRDGVRRPITINEAEPAEIQGGVATSAPSAVEPVDEGGNEDEDQDEDPKKDEDDVEPTE